MANEFKIKKGLIVTGADGGTVVDIQGSQGQLFSVTDDLSGSIFAVSDISGVPILDINSSGLVTVDGPFTQIGGGASFSGNVGIGTTSPGAKLDVRSDSRTAPVVLKLGNGIISGDNGVIVSQIRSYINNSNTNADELARIQVENGTGSHDDGNLSFWTRDGFNNVDAAKQLQISGNGVIDIKNDGTAALPVLIFGADVDTGFFRPSSNNIALSTSGVERMRINSAGNVGIGTTSPRGKLDIVGNTDDDTDFLTIQDNDTSAGSHRPSIRFRSNTAQIGQIVSLDNSMRFSVGTTEDSLLEITSSGNVGIGTATPLQPFQVDAGSNIASFRSVGTGQNNKELLIQTGGDRVVLDAKNADDGTAASLAFELGNSEKARLTTTGLGIGTTSPAAKLHVDGTAIFDTQTGAQPFYITRDGVTNQALKIHVDDAAAIFESIQDEAADNYGAFQFILDAGVTEPYFDVRKGAGLANTLFRVDGNGNVGIGTTSPSRLLNLYSNNTETTPRFLIEQDGTGDAVMAFSLTGGQGWAMGIDNSIGDSFMIHNNAGGVDSSSQFTIENNGNVGIGTSNPSYKLDVVGSANNADVGIRIHNTFDDNNSASEPNASLILNAASNNGYLRVHGAPANTSAKHQIDLGSTDVISFLTFSPSGSEKMRIASNGNVGIGTATPACKLHLAGTSTVVYNPATVGGQNSASTIKITNDVTDANTYAAINFSTNSNRVVNRIVSSHADTTNRGFLAFVTEHLGQSGERMRIASDGSVGIGTTSPLVKLDINSTDAIKVPVGTTAQRPTGANGMLRYSTTGNQFEGFADGAWGAIGGGGGGNTTVVVDTFSGDNSDVTFNITNTIANEDNVQIYIDGVYQSKSNYSTSGVTITFSTAPPSGTNNIEVTHFVQINGAPSIEVDTFNGNASTTAFTLTTAPATKNNLQIYIDGVYQAKANYSVSGTTLTFTTAPATGTNNIEVTHLKIS